MAITAHLHWNENNYQWVTSYLPIEPYITDSHIAPKLYMDPFF